MHLPAELWPSFSIFYSADELIVLCLKLVTVCRILFSRRRYAPRGLRPLHAPNHRFVRGGLTVGEGFDLAVFLFSCFLFFAASIFFFLLAQDSFSVLTVMEINFLTSESPSHRRLLALPESFLASERALFQLIWSSNQC